MRVGSGRGVAVLLVSGLAVTAVLHAESLYVIEQLVVDVSSTPDAGGERVATLRSGDRVEALERAGDEMHVRLANGREGWLRESTWAKGEWTDDLLYAMLAREWAAGQHSQPDPDPNRSST